MATFIELFILFMVVKYFLLASYRKPKVAKYSLFMEGYPVHLFGYLFLFIIYIRWVSVVEFHDQALSIGKVFGQESTVVKWN